MPEIIENKKLYTKKYNLRPDVKKHRSKYNKEYNALHEIHETKIKNSRDYHSKPEVKRHESEYSKRYRKIYLAKLGVKQRRYKETAKYIKNRLQEDAQFRLANNLRKLIRNTFNRFGYSKKSKTFQLLGLNFETMKNWLEYTWFLNYGTEYSGQKVHIDHIVPGSSAKTKEELIALQHWTNLQYLTPEDNISKGSRIPVSIVQTQQANIG
jgi:hypothetical protein